MRVKRRYLRSPGSSRTFGSGTALGLLVSLMTSLPAAVDQAAAAIQYDEDAHPAEDGRYENLVEQIDVINRGVMLRAGPVVAEPGVGEVRGRVRVAPLAGDQQVLFDDPAFRVVNLAHVMHALAIDAGWYVRIALADQRGAVHAVLVQVEDL